jgi:hypothetical protein
MEIIASRRATQYIRRRGRSLYVWSDTSQLMQVATERPRGIEFERFEGHRFAVFVQQGLPLGSWISVERDAFPPWRLTVGWRDMPT